MRNFLGVSADPKCPSVRVVVCLCDTRVVRVDSQWMGVCNSEEARERLKGALCVTSGLGVDCSGRAVEFCG